MNKTMTMRISSCVIGCVLGAGCGSNSNPPDGVDGAAGPVVAATSWTLAGTLEFPAGETADQLMLVATTNETQYSASTYAGAPLALTYSGSPPVATFSLPIDTTKLGPLTGDAIMSLVVFQDANGNGVNDVGEPLRQIGAVDASSAVFGDGTQYDVDADFQYIAFGASEEWRRRLVRHHGPRLVHEHLHDAGVQHADRYRAHDAVRREAQLPVLRHESDLS